MLLVIPATLGQQIADRTDFLKNYRTKNFEQQEYLACLLGELQRAHTPNETLRTIHQLQRTYYAAQLGLLDNPAVFEALDGYDDFPLWDRYASLPVDAEKKDVLAKLLYEGDVDRQTPALLICSDYAQGIMDKVLERCLMENDEVDILISDPVFQRRLLNHCNVEQAEKLGNLLESAYAACERRIATRVEQVSQPFVDPSPAEDVQAAYTAAANKASTHMMSKFYTMTVLPTPKDAELDQMPYDEYLDLYFRMIDVDWDKVGEAHQVLIEQLNAGSHLRITNDDGTDLSMDISGFTFCDSRVAKNVPGSEVFSAPHRESVEGILVGKGRYAFNGEIMENITLKFEKGKIVEYYAENGQDVLEKMIETDEGSHYIGEIGIGTNPVLRKHLINGLMVEKAGGSIHVAVGKAYPFTKYGGVPVHVDNGNRSGIHEDLAVSLFGKKGKMYLDNKLIMDNGTFLDPRLAYLNGNHPT